MPKARARLAPTTSMISAPTTDRMIWVWITAGWRMGVPRRRGRSASAVPSTAASGSRPSGGGHLLLQVVGHARARRPGRPVAPARAGRPAAGPLGAGRVGAGPRPAQGSAPRQRPGPGPVADERARRADRSLRSLVARRQRHDLPRFSTSASRCSARRCRGSRSRRETTSAHCLSVMRLSKTTHPRHVGRRDVVEQLAMACVVVERNRPRL